MPSTEPKSAKKKRKRSSTYDTQSSTSAPNGATQSSANGERRKKKKRKSAPGADKAPSNGVGVDVRGKAPSNGAADNEKALCDVVGARSFPLASSISLPGREALLSLGAEEQRACFAQLGSTCERLLHLMEDVRCAVTGGDANTLAAEDAFVADMAKLRGVPFSRQFSEQWLWKGVSRSTAVAEATVRRLVPDVNADKAVVRDAVANTIGDDLDRVRENEALDNDGVRKLLLCLEEAAEVHAAAASC